MATLGNELISSEIVALSELVKNAYDADAHHVMIRFQGGVRSDGSLDPNTACIHILDDGCGMSEQTLLGAWLEPATAYRAREKVTRSGRRVLGEKGVGRFATAKLGEQLEITSKMKNHDEVRLRVDWSDFENADLYLDQVDVEFESRPASFFDAANAESAAIWSRSSIIGGHSQLEQVCASGTLLKIDRLRSRWTRHDVQVAQNALARLISPLDSNPDIERDFRIEFVGPDDLGFDGEIQQDEIFQKPNYQLIAEVNERGVATVMMQLKDSQQIDTEDVDLTPDGSILPCGPFLFSLNVWDRDTASLRQIARTAKIAREALDGASGISIYRDRFRVLPYGEPRNDWLRLDLRRVNNPTLRLSNNQIIGYVRITRDGNPNLRDQSNREGLIEGPALDSLRDTIGQLIALLEQERYKQRPRASRQSRPSLLSPVDLSPITDLLSERYPGDTEAQQHVASAQQEIDDRLRHAGETLAQYHRLATLGQLVDIIVHEAAQPIATIGHTAYAGVELTNALASHGHELDQSAGQVLAQFERIQEQNQRIDEVIKRVKPFGGRKRGRPQRFTVESAINNVVGLMAPQMDEAGVQITISPTQHEVSLDGTETQEVLFNLLNNSLHWLMKVPRDKRKVDISVTRCEDDALSIMVEDSGPGIADHDQDHIFDAYFSTKPDGTGLGLAIAGTIIKDYYDGNLELLSPGELGGARFRAVFRKRVT
ncbi:sensor histidine kinase [Candidatus Poriferisodalis sp.]|uniref:sensor histidine kinase n=1 Tax=Candidatus Poriferisodalis sp. TaxID=3101277 RepID=UPI003B01C97C